MENVTENVSLHFAQQEDLDPHCYPRLDNLSAAFVWQFLPVPKSPISPPEFIFVPVRHPRRWDEEDMEQELAIAEWNSAWEAGPLRLALFAEKLPKSLQWLIDYENQNLCLIPGGSWHGYEAYAPLFHLLPRRVLAHYRLPLLKRGLWPIWMAHQTIDRVLPKDFKCRLSQAFAYYIWPLMNSGSKSSAFSRADSLRLLAHNLDFWLPYIDIVAQSRMKSLGRVRAEDKKQATLLRKLKSEASSDYIPSRPLHGGSVWYGEEEAWEATKELIHAADRFGKLRNIIDAIRSHRVEEDFSSHWSYAREDFERKLYHKRSKVKVTFVELDDTIPVHGPESEVHENLLWEDFLAVFDPKERRIIVCLRNGITKIGEIGRILGYANHSPVSKALSRIRRKARSFLDQ